MRSLLIMAATILVLEMVSAHHARPAEPEDAASGCLACHQGIEPIRQPGSNMLEAILDEGESRDDPAGCVVCHGGDPGAEAKEAAHAGEAFYPDPGSSWINENTCGLCHRTHVRVQWHSLMMTEAGKIQGTAWAFGSLTGYRHKWGNYDVRNPEDNGSRLGTDAYRAYMEHLKTVEPDVFVDEHERLPDAPRDLGNLAETPGLAAFTYLRNQCLRCHHAVKGRQVRGDYRGMGCSSCHVPYGNEGLYEGGDETIPRDEPGHCLVHTIQATRDAKVTVHGHQYSGIPVETCTTCHDRGKRIGVSFQGLMETAYTSPYTEDAAGQPALHTKHYIAMHQDVHYQKGMTCQDCHTSIDVHGDGFLAAANLGSVQIECSDCHGTPDAYPWELSLGFMDEYEDPPVDGPPRGTAKELPSHVRDGMRYPTPDAVTDREAAAIALVGITADLGLFRDARLQPGESLFVHGGSGGVGSCVVQMAKAIGARVITTAGSDEKAEACRQLGADAVVNYKTENVDEAIARFAPGGLDVWWETLREQDLEQAVGHLALRGRIILMAGRDARPPFPVGPFYVKDCSVHGFAMFNSPPDEQRQSAVAINRWMKEGKLRARIARVMPLAETAAAHRLQEENTLQMAGTLAGKIVLEPPAGG